MNRFGSLEVISESILQNSEVPRGQPYCQIDLFSGGETAGIGLLSPALLDKIVPVGNAAGSGAKRMVCDAQLPEEAQRLVEKIEFIELADIPDFRRCFSVHMGL